MKPNHVLRVVSLCLLGASAHSLHAFVFNVGDISGSFDSTLTAGAAYRLNNPDPSLFGLSNGGQQFSVNADDGNLNYRRGLWSTAVKGTHDLELKWQNFGAFVRGGYLYDFENENNDRDRTPLSDDALDWVGSRAEFLDAYVVAKFNLAERPVDLRFGRQVLSLGESTFIPNGINIINPVDVSRLRVPGSELREALLPVNMLKASVGLTNTLSVEAFWLLEFRRTELDPSGSYFSTNDFATRGGQNVYLGFGSLSDQGTLGRIPRGPDHEGNNFNQFGATLKLSAPALNNTEFGLTFAKIHSRLPLISAVTPTGPISSALVQSTALGLGQQQLVPAIITNTGDSANASSVANSLVGLALLNTPAANIPLVPGLPTYAPLFYSSAQSIARGAGQVGLLTAAANGRYFIEYPEDIKLYGLSFNTSLGRTGIAWQGEVSLKQDTPLQVDDVELLFATLSALTPTFGAPNNQLGSYLGQYSTYISGYRRHDVWTAQTTLTKVFGPTLGASQLTVLGEIGGVYIPQLPQTSALRYEGFGTYTSGSQAAQTATTGSGSPLPAEDKSYFADPFSWGYQLLARLDYNNLFAGVNFSPAIAFAHDVSGNTPLPLGNFLEHRKSINLVAEFTWQNSWTAEIRYVNFFGGDRHNLLTDRDFVSTSLKYSF